MKKALTNIFLCFYATCLYCQYDQMYETMENEFSTFQNACGFSTFSKIKMMGNSFKFGGMSIYNDKGQVIKHVRMDNFGKQDHFIKDSITYNKDNKIEKIISIISSETFNVDYSIRYTFSKLEKMKWGEIVKIIIYDYDDKGNMKYTEQIDFRDTTQSLNHIYKNEYNEKGQLTKRYFYNNFDKENHLVNYFVHEKDTIYRYVGETKKLTSSSFRFNQTNKYLPKDYFGFGDAIRTYHYDEYGRIKSITSDTEDFKAQYMRNKTGEIKALKGNFNGTKYVTKYFKNKNCG